MPKNLVKLVYIDFLPAGYFRSLLDINIISKESYFNFTSIQESMNEILFEEYQFQAVLRVNGELKF